MDNSETYRDVPATGPNGMANEPPAAPPPPPANVAVDDSQTTADYANFCRLSGTPEELLIDFGINSQPMGPTTQPVMVTQRIVTGWHTAKRLLYVLHRTVERHEAVFGALETDVQKRIRHR
jgi:hypothetical protein